MIAICRLLPLLLLAVVAKGQEDRLSEREAEMERRIRARAERGNGEKQERDGGRTEKDEEEELARLTPEERLARSVRSNASAFCRFVPALKPAKLLPGQSGTLVISALFNGQAVMPSPAPMELLGGNRQGVVTLGGLSVQPAEMGRHASAYLGRPVYDNYAILEIPVTVAPDAPLGTKQPVSIDLRFDIYDGASAQPIGRFVDRINAEVEVGRVPDPAVVGMPVAAGDAGPTREAPSTTVPSQSTEPAAGSAGRIIGAQAAPSERESQVPPVQEPEGSGATDPDWSRLDAEDRASPAPFWIGGGVLLLALVLLLTRKK